MESPILKQIVNFLQTRKKQKQWMVVFVFMAVVVGFGTVTALKMMGQAMTRKEHVLDCQLKLHEHTKSCYDSNKNLICGYADYAVHKHNDDCYNSEGKLMCRLPEVEKHEHTKKCYEKIETLVCGQEESAGHEHTDGCYTTQKGDLKCKTEEHSHSDGCYDEEGNLTCGKEEHQHNDDCYKYEDVLTCKIKEGEGGHKHTDKCYDVQEVLTCGKLEMHKHTDKCFEKIDKNGKDEPENLKLVCKKTELLEHTHTEDAGCLRTVDAAEADVIQAGLDKEAEEAALDKAAEEGREIFTTDMNEEEENGEDAEAAEGEESEAAEGEDAVNPEGEAAESEDGAAADEAEPETYEETKTYEGLGYIVTASYNKDANIPEEAKFVAERITKESDEEDYKKHEEEYKKSVGNENATMSALFKLGFYVNDEEVEPESPVMVTVQFVDKNGLPEGAPIKVVHFGDDKTEVIKGSKAESGSTSFKTDGFSIFGFGPDEETDGADEADTDKVSVHISESAVYEDDVFSATFHIEGDVKMAEEDAKNLQGGNDNESSDNKSEKTEDGVTEEDTTAQENTGNSEEANESDQTESEDGESSEDTANSEEGDVTGEVASDESNGKLKFEVKALDEDNDNYVAVLNHIEQSDEKDEMLRLQMVSYSLTYEGEEVDISGCKVTTEITTAKTLNEQAQLSVPEAVKQILGEDKAATVDEKQLQKKTRIKVTAMQVSDAEKVEVVGETHVNQREVDEPIADVISSKDDGIAMAAYSSEDTVFTVQYYAYSQILEDKQTGNSEAISIINTSTGEGKGNKILPTNGNVGTYLKNLYVRATGETKTHTGLDGGGKQSTVNWPVYEPVYKNKETTDSLTKLYTAEKYEFREVQASGLKNINKFAKAGLNFDLYEVWIMQNVTDKNTVDTTDKAGWDVYKKETEGWSVRLAGGDTADNLKDIMFTNNADTAKAIDGNILITKDTVVRVVGKSNVTKNKSYPTRFFDYDISNGGDASKGTLNVNRQGINNASYYSTGKSSSYGFGNNNCGETGLKEEKIDGHYINQAVRPNGTYAKTIREKCAYQLVEKRLSESGFPIIKANAPDLFNPEANNTGVQGAGKTVISGRSLIFDRDRDTYTLHSVSGSGNNANNLNQFQKGSIAYKTDGDQIWTNQFWPMDNADSFGTSGHDMKSGTHAQKSNTGFEVADDFQEHNYFFGMNFEVGFELTDDYVGPLNYYFFGDDDMWVFLEHPNGDTELVCDIGGVHQAAGEYVNLWNYIDKPEDGEAVKNNTEENRPKKSYKLKFFYTERGASGSTCWMQFTLPSVNAVPMKDYTGGVKSTLTVKKEINGDNIPEDIKNKKFKFKITFSGDSANVDTNDYPYEIRKGSEVVERGDIRSGGEFELSHEQTIEVFNLPDETTYTIKEVNGDGYTPSLGENAEQNGVIIKDEVVTGEINWENDDEFDFINNPVKYELPETGGSGLMIYTIAGALCILFGAGFMYTKKARERRV